MHIAAFFVPSSDGISLFHKQGYASTPPLGRNCIANGREVCILPEKPSHRQNPCPAVAQDGLGN
jgi:hypothetical protein